MFINAVVHLLARDVFFVKQYKRTNGNVSLRVATNPMVEYLSYKISQPIHNTLSMN